MSVPTCQESALFIYQEYLILGDHVLEEEGQVHQSDTEAHRHLSSHGSAAAPGQLRGTSWSPAGGPPCECQGVSVSVWEGVPGQATWVRKHQVPSLGLFTQSLSTTC